MTTFTNEQVEAAFFSVLDEDIDYLIEFDQSEGCPGEWHIKDTLIYATYSKVQEMFGIVSDDIAADLCAEIRKQLGW